MPLKRALYMEFCFSSIDNNWYWLITTKEILISVSFILYTTALFTIETISMWKGWRHCKSKYYAEVVI